MTVTLPAGPILVSACLLGERCRYDGGCCRHAGVLAAVQGREVISVCPEVLGGLPTPRPPAEIRGGDGRAVLAGEARVVDRLGKDCTDAFVAGAMTALALAEKHGARAAILKARSPSCGGKRIYDGTFRKALRTGMGVTAALFVRKGLLVMDEDDCAQRSSF